MASAIQGLFSGVAVVIDDQAHAKTDKNLDAIIETIHAAGGLAIIHTALPKKDELSNYSSVAFVMMDWDLTPPGLSISEENRQALFEENVEFIRALGAHRHTPVVIFTNENLEEVTAVLNAHVDMRSHLASGRLLLRDKAEVGDKIYEVLNQWANEIPSVLALKTWEQQSVRALNDLFIDLHDRSPHWPVMLWETYSHDGPAPADELGKLITRLVASRMDQLELDLSRFVGEIDAKHRDDPAEYERTLKRVLEGERVLDVRRLHADSSAPGDFFQTPEATTSIYINVRPECDAIRRAGRSMPDLYLLKGQLVDPSKIDIHADHGQILDRDDQFTVYSMFNGASYRFGFKDLTIKKWEDWSKHRKGRLLSPFATRLQQKFAAYLQRSGLPAIPRVLRSSVTDSAETGETAAADGTAQA
ncbi:hypothetical protein GCM10007164_11240 [Luteimonas padinae]|uniref:Response receiver domain-containing protein n=1 Tax=Luteimonas padinae TaxID=1714359 RepID=A0ABV6ST11_9GAMM|nr:hypothetical protein [Luteimonas padinae]GHD68925.1 hypothetical protein GCM10007164_11240 [Luteimonas padinae]